MGRMLLYFSTRWVRYRVSSAEKKLRAENKAYLAENETLTSQLADLRVEYEKEQVNNVIRQNEIDSLTKVIERDRHRVAAEIRAFGLTGEEADAS